jgi:hypothetical protein
MLIRFKVNPIQFKRISLYIIITNFISFITLNIIQQTTCLRIK